jgi:hypothetical protein
MRNMSSSLGKVRVWRQWQDNPKIKIYLREVDLFGADLSGGGHLKELKCESKISGNSNGSILAKNQR